MSFRIGQKVVCVGTWPPACRAWRHRWYRFWHPYKSPVKDRVYTISNLYLADSGNEMVELAELTEPKFDFWLPGFYACGFRPAVDRKTDISIFTKMLNAKKRERAR